MMVFFLTHYNYIFFWLRCVTVFNLYLLALYEDECESDLSMESHGNVMTHLLSQVKIGMDLTKVVLPTFILERRSLLEMYADYFAHPDLFLK